MRVFSQHRSLIDAGVVVSGTICIAILHYLTPGSLTLWDNLFQHLYFLPVVIAAFRFGWRGGVAGAALAAVGYALNVASTQTRMQPFSGYFASQSAEVIDFFLVGVVAGLWSERERRQKQALERATLQLKAVYQELQDNFERMKRSERLYAIGQLSAGLAHEVRNPLASIGGAVAMLKKNRTGEGRRQELLEIVERECRRLSGMLTNFLDFARPREPRYQPVDVGGLLGSVIELANHAVGRVPLRMRAQVSPAVPCLECDPEQFKQVLLNLTINAIQAMPKGGEIVLSARAENGNVVIDVRDQGTGMAPENMEKMFDPFFTTKENGTGLGLSVAHQIVQQHGGALRAKNNADGGMTFTVVLPAGPAAT